jgi:hypothetical protein
MSSTLVLRSSNSHRTLSELALVFDQTQVSDNQVFIADPSVLTLQGRR